MKSCLILISILILTLRLSAQPKMFDQPLSSRLANYEIEVSLDPKLKKLYGSEVITWTNKSDDHVPDLQFHLYPG